MMEQEAANNARYSELLTTPMDTLVKTEDDAAITGTEAFPDGEGLSVTMLAAHNVDSMSALDVKVLDYIWTEVIAWDICTYWVGAPAGTFTVELLSDTEFLLFQGPQSGHGMTWGNTILYIRDLHGMAWHGMVSGQHSMKQSKIDLANIREYRWVRTLGWMATTEGRLWALAIEKTKIPVPQSRGW